MDTTKAYRFGPGFAFRRESFGGILYHYEGVKPDPRVSFVDSPFLMDLLERLDDGPLEALLQRVRDHFAMTPSQEQAMRDFFQALVKRGALVERGPAPHHS